MQPLWERLAEARVFDLAQPWFVGMPHYPTHPPYAYSLTKQHGEFVLPGGASSAADAIALGTHTGTHIDALCHFSCGGLLHGGRPAAEVQSYGAGLGVHAAAGIAPVFRRGVLLDVAAYLGVAALAEDHLISATELAGAAAAQGAAPRAGDVALIRTGWGALWRDPRRMVNELRAPGPGIEAARWLSAHGIHAAGSDTLAFEFLPSPAMAVHVHLLVEGGIHIIEALQLEELSRAGVHEFLFAAIPLKLEGATGSPLRPLALA
jgi:kynurenine formamidase